MLNHFKQNSITYQLVGVSALISLLPILLFKSSIMLYPTLHILITIYTVLVVIYVSFIMAYAISLEEAPDELLE